MKTNITTYVLHVRTPTQIFLL